MALRERVVAFVEEGHSHRAAAARFRVSVKFVNDMVLLKRETGGLEPRRQGNGGGHGKLGRLRDWIAARMTAKPDLKLDDVVLEIAEEHQMTVGVCQTSCPPISCSVSDFRGADFGFWIEPDGSSRLPVSGFA
jgi:transposase